MVLPPPCAMHSPLNWSLDHGRVVPDLWATRWETADVLLDLATEWARGQVRHGEFFVFEHPATATSWRAEMVQGVANLG
eukprot:11793552-Alexandrium_andersonii.AAC.1